MKTETVPTALSDCAPSLTAKLAPWIKDLLLHPEQIEQFLTKYGSPCHLVVKSEFERNVSDFLSPFKSRGLSGKIFFARKANKLPCFVSAASKIGIGVDTASLPELTETLALGVSPEKVIVTAIGKNKALLSKAVSAGCLIIADNLDELEQIRAVANELQKEAVIGLRFAGFQVASRVVFSRFGFPVDEFREIFSVVKCDPLLRLKVLHAHIDRYDIAERAAAARQLITMTDYAKRNGITIEALDLGGGVLMRYLDSAKEWQLFQKKLTESVKGLIQRFTYQGDGLGYMRGQVGELLGQADLYPAWNNVSKERFVAAVLDDAHGGTPLHKELSDRGLELYFEPGRSLLDNCGVTLAKVTFRKRDTEGHLLIGLEMNRTNLRPFRAEFCCDPIFVHYGDRAVATEGAFLVGNLCSESDLIFKRKIRLAKMPLVGDVVLFPNTAGYLAHHMEIGTHGGPLPKNLLIDPQSWKVSDVK